MKSNQYIFIAGLGSTGSSAVCDILREIELFHVEKGEWRIWTDPGCIIDLCNTFNGNISIFTATNSIRILEKKMNQISGFSLTNYSHLNLSKDTNISIRNIAINIKKLLVEFCYKGIWYGNSNYLQAKLNFVFSRLLWKKNFINSDMFLCKTYKNNDLIYKQCGEIIENSIDKLMFKFNANKIGLNENFSILFADEIFKLHPNSKMICCIRNPFDVYADSLRVGWLAMPYEINKFIFWQNNMLKNVLKKTKKYPEKILLIDFDDLVLDYDRSLDLIYDFISIDKSEHRKFSYFNPDISLKNIHQWEKTCSWIEKYKDKFNYFKRS